MKVMVAPSIYLLGGMVDTPHLGCGANGVRVRVSQEVQNIYCPMV